MSDTKCKTCKVQMLIVNIDKPNHKMFTIGNLKCPQCLRTKSIIIKQRG